VTWLDLVKQRAAAHGVALTDTEAEFVLWERTAFPVAGRAEVERQLDEEFMAGAWLKAKEAP